MSIIKYLLVVAYAQVFEVYWKEILIIFGVCLLAVFVNVMLKYKEEKNGRMNHENQNNTSTDEPKPDTIGLMFRTLSNLGCQPTKDDDGTISVKYQGENFKMQFGGMYARVWDPMWSSIKADDPDLPNIREAVNDANYSFGPTIVMTKPDDEGIITFHSRCDIMLHPAVPDNEPYVAAILDSFFKIKEQLQADYQQIVSQQMETRKARRPVGFTTNTDTNE